MFPFVFAAFMIAGFIGLAIYAGVREKKRREGLRLIASELGLEYGEALSGIDAERFYRFPLAQRGKYPKASSAIIAESDDKRMVLFDYQYVTGSGKHRKTHHLATLLCYSPRLNVPSMSLEPESWTNKVATFFGGQDICFEEDPAFSTVFRLRGPDPEAIRKFLIPVRREKLREHFNDCVEAHGDSFILYRKYKQLSAADVHSLLKDGLATAEALGLNVDSN